jgi:hypothetical protein
LTILDDDIGEFITASQNVSLLRLDLPFAILCGNRAFVLGLVILRFPFIFFLRPRFLPGEVLLSSLLLAGRSMEGTVSDTGAGRGELPLRLGGSFLTGAMAVFRRQEGEGEGEGR